VRRLAALLLAALLAPVASGFSCGFEGDLCGFSFQYSTPGARYRGPELDCSTAREGRCSLRFEVSSATGAPETASFRTPIFRMGLDEMRARRLVRFWVRAEVPAGGAVRVVVWVRGRSAAERGLAFHEAGASFALAELRSSTDWRLLELDYFAALSGWRGLERENEWYIEWYVDSSSSSPTRVWVDSFEVAGAPLEAREPQLEPIVLPSASVAARGALVRVAVYAAVREAQWVGPIDASLQLPEGLGLAGVEGEAAVVGPGRVFKKVFYVQAREPGEYRVPVVLTYEFLGSRFERRVGEVSLRVVESGAPLLSVSREVRVDGGGYEADVTVRVANVGTAPARWVRVGDLLPKGLYVVSGGVKAQVEEIGPGSSFELRYTVRAMEPGAFQLPPPRVVYYAGPGEEYWAFGEPSPVELRPAPPGYAREGVEYSRRLLPEPPEPSERWYVVDVSTASLEEQLLAASLEGLVNRRRPCVYLVYGDAERAWLPRLQLMYGIVYEPISLRELLSRFAGVAKGYVVYDPAMPDTINVATMLAAAYDLLVVAPSLEGVVQGLGLQRAWDLRGRWSSREEMYLWAIRNLLPMMSDRMVYVCHTRVPPPGWDVINVHFRDHAVAERIFTLSASPAEDGRPYTPVDYVIFEELYDRFTPPTLVLGWWWDEWSNVARASSRGLVVTATDYLPNLSLWRALPEPFPLALPHPRPGRLDPSAVYVAILQSDGDNSCVDHSFLGGKGGLHWLDPARGSELVNWGVQPLLIELAPPILAYLYSTATPLDRFFAGPSGAGYYYPALVPEAARGLVYDLNQYYLRASDLLAATVLGVGDEDRGTMVDFARYSGVAAVHHGYGRERRGVAHRHAVVAGVPWLFTLIDGKSVEGALRAVDELAASGRRPLFAVIHCINWEMSYGDMAELARRLRGRGYRVVSFEELASLFLEAVEAGLVEAEVLEGGRLGASFPQLDAPVEVRVGNASAVLPRRYAALVERVLGLAGVDAGVRGRLEALLAEALGRGDVDGLVGALNRYAYPLLAANSLASLLGRARALGANLTWAAEGYGRVLDLLRRGRPEEAAREAELLAPRLNTALLAAERFGPEAPGGGAGGGQPRPRPQPQPQEAGEGWRALVVGVAAAALAALVAALLWLLRRRSL